MNYNYAQMRVLDEAASIVRAVKKEPVPPGFPEVLARLADVAMARHTAATKLGTFHAILLYSNAVEWCKVAEHLIDRPELRPAYLPTITAALVGLEAGMLVGVQL
jgi:hypothetical protein